MNGLPLVFYRVTQKFVMLSMTEAEIAAGMMVEQVMQYVYPLLELLELKVGQ